jgi:hypothetical protein
VFDTITGLPVHALVVHAVVVLGPLCALGTLVAAFSRAWFERLSTVLVVLLGLTWISALVARQSGFELRDSRNLGGDQLTRHAHLGTWLPLVMLVYWLFVVGWVWADRRRGPDAGVTKAFLVLSVVGAVGSTVLVVLVGDAGARAVWG